MVLMQSTCQARPHGLDQRDLRDWRLYTFGSGSATRINASCRSGTREAPLRGYTM